MKALAGGFNHPIKNICNSSKNPSNHHLVDYTVPTIEVSYQPMELATNQWSLLPGDTSCNTLRWFIRFLGSQTSHVLRRPLGSPWRPHLKVNGQVFRRITKGLGEKRCQVLQPNTKIGWEWKGSLFSLLKPQKKAGGMEGFDDLWVFLILWRFGFWCYYFHAMVVWFSVFFSFLWLHSSKLRMAARVDNVDRLMANCWVLAGGHGVFLNRLLFSENIFVKCFNGSWESYFEFQE